MTAKSLKSYLIKRKKRIISKRQDVILYAIENWNYEYGDQYDLAKFIEKKLRHYFRKF